MRTRFRPLTLVAFSLALALAFVGPSPQGAVPASAAPSFLPDGAHFAGGWSLRLAAVGRSDDLAATDPVIPRDTGSRVEYRHTGDVTEWYVRQGGDGDGIEQGVTLAARPVGDGPLVLTIATPGAMALVVDADTGDAAMLVLPDGTQWVYAGLHVTDATGRTLPALLTQAAGGIGIRVADAEAVYPVTVDPFVQRQTLAAADGASGDSFGTTVAVSADGTAALVGAYGRGNFTGAAYVFTRNGSVYSQTQTLAATSGASSDSFGTSVALSADGSTALIGAFGRNNSTGAAYVFTRSGGVYSQTQTLTAADGTSGDRFGYRVALSADGNTTLVGAFGRTSFTGAAYVFTRSGGMYGQAQALTATDGASSNDFGRSIALSADGNTALIGAFGRNSSTGAAYVFTRSGNTYSQAQTLTALGGVANDTFGYSVALSADGNTALVGAVGRNSMGAAYVFTRSGGVYSQTAALADPTGGANYDQFGISMSLSVDGSTAIVGATGRNGIGAAYVFTRSGGVYSQTQALTATGGAASDRFGASVALPADGSVALVGAPFRNSSVGAAYVFINAPALASVPGTPQSAVVGQSFANPLAVALTDSFGASLVGASVTFTAPAGGASGTFVGGATTATVTTDANGVATAPTFTANTAAGNYSVIASASTTGGGAAIALSLTNTAGIAASITAVSGGNGTAQIGNAFTAPLTVLVQDSHRNPVPGVTVTFAAPTGVNVPTATFPGGITATTDSTGLASVNVTAAGRPGVFTVTAAVSGVSGASTSFTLTDTANSSTVLITGFSPATGPTTGGNTVTLTGTNFGGPTSVTFDTTAAGGITVVNPTTITVTAPVHAAGTVDIIVTTNGQTATIHGYTYLPATGGIAPQPVLHPLPGSGNGGGSGMPAPAPAPVRHTDAGGGNGGSEGVQPQAAGVPTATPNVQPARH